MLVVLIVFAIIIYIEVPEFIKEGYWREMVFFSIMTAIAFVMSTLFVMGIPIINPVKFMIYVVRDVLHLNYR
ncbi:hypothetical protein [Clostridium oryzae]|uniref:Uncharacterized protein n=1 Tax=Clostridium oryzae TaxID=1450648 RepID=A0A1V4IEZ2_9CLOT|nr:hypothetical protein [Clostridium oryzae]OPJ58097.1 hypothetical protein CLORY_37740 [Clostridium oryzae]